MHSQLPPSVVCRTDYHLVSAQLQRLGYRIRGKSKRIESFGRSSHYQRRQHMVAARYIHAVDEHGRHITFTLEYA